MITCILHTMDPLQFAILEQQFATILCKVTSLQRIPAGCDRIPGAAHGRAPDTSFQIVRLAITKTEVFLQTEFVVDAALRVAVDWEPALCAFLVVWQGRECAAADDG